MNPLTEKPIKLLATYARVSENPDDEEQSIKNQAMSFSDLAEKNDWQIMQEYKDDDWTGDILERPALDQLRLDAKSKNRAWEAVLIYDPDRLARRYSYQELVMDELREAGVEVIFVTVSAPKNAEDKILHGVRGLFAEYERAKITERFRLGKLRKVREGHVLTTKPLYGYNYTPNEYLNSRLVKHGYYTINEDEAKIVRMIFNWVGGDQLTLRTVVRKLQEQDIKPKNSKRGVWSTSTLSTMLRHKGYIGQAHWGSSYAVIPDNPRNTSKYRKNRKSSRRTKPETEWIAPNIPIPQIIQEDLFDKVQIQLKTNFELCKRNTKNHYLLGGKIFCSCGKKRCGEGPQHGKHLYYRCSDRVYSFPLPPTCREKGINARIADNLVWDKIKQLMSAPDLLRKHLSTWGDERKNKARASVIDVEAVKKEINNLEIQIDRYNRAYGEGVLSLLKLSEYTEPKKKRAETLQLQLTKAEQEEKTRQTSVMPTQDELKLFSEAAKETLQDLSFETKQEIVRNTVVKIVGTQKQLQVSGNIPLTSLNHVKFNSFNRNRWIT